MFMPHLGKGKKELKQKWERVVRKKSVVNVIGKDLSLI